MLHPNSGASFCFPLLVVPPCNHQVHVCEVCGSEHVQWVGRCPTCKEWNCVKPFRVRREEGIKNRGDSSSSQILDNCIRLSLSPECDPLQTWSTGRFLLFCHWSHARPRLRPCSLCHICLTISVLLQLHPFNQYHGRHMTIRPARNFCVGWRTWGSRLRLCTL